MGLGYPRLCWKRHCGVLSWAPLPRTRGRDRAIPRAFFSAVYEQSAPGRWRVVAAKGFTGTKLWALGSTLGACSNGHRHSCGYLAQIPVRRVRRRLRAAPTCRCAGGRAQGGAGVGGRCRRRDKCGRLVLRTHHQPQQKKRLALFLANHRGAAAGGGCGGADGGCGDGCGAAVVRARRSTDRFKKRTTRSRR